MPQFAVPTAEGVRDALEVIQAACKARMWTLIAPDGRVWQNNNPMLISAALLAELGGYMQPLGGDFARILDENRTTSDTERLRYMMAENIELRHKADKLNTAMLMLAKLRDSAHYPKGGYSSDIQTEWDAMLNQWFGEARPCFHS